MQQTPPLKVGIFTLGHGFIMTALTATLSITGKHFAAAIDGYTRAIDLNPTGSPAYYSNRAICYIKLESYGAAIADATKALEIDPAFVKVLACPPGLPESPSYDASLVLCRPTIAVAMPTLPWGSLRWRSKT